MAKPRTEPNPPATHSAPTTFDFLGAKHDVGDVVVIGDESVTIAAHRHVKTTPTSGLTEGFYTILASKDGSRDVYRVYHEGVFYPVKKYGTADEIIGKVRAARGSSETKQSPSADMDLVISTEADRTLCEYLELHASDGIDASRAISDLIMAHMGPEVEQARAAAAAIKTLPKDILARLGQTNLKALMEALDIVDGDRRSAAPASTNGAGHAPGFIPGAGHTIHAPDPGDDD